MFPFLFDVWGCLPEISKSCIDMTNASSTYLGIIGGAIIGAIVSWWIYNRQKHTSAKQDRILSRIKNLEENHTNILKKIEGFDDKHESSLDTIDEINKKIDRLLKKLEDEKS